MYLYAHLEWKANVDDPNGPPGQAAHKGGPGEVRPGESRGAWGLAQLTPVVRAAERQLDVAILVCGNRDHVSRQTENLDQGHRTKAMKLK